MKAILTADWHIGDKQPVCRMDNYRETMKRKIEFIFKCSFVGYDSGEWNYPILHAGDFLDNWKISDETKNWLLDFLPPLKIYTAPGNHELPGHNIALYKKTSLALLERMWVYVPKDVFYFYEEDGRHIIQFFPYNMFNSFDSINKDATLVLMHEMIFNPKEELPPWAENKFSVNDLLDNLPKKCKGVVCGHNHKSFIAWRKGKFFLSPGSIFRMDADQFDQEPKVFLFDSEKEGKEMIQEIIIPHDKDVVSREHLEKIKEKDSRLASFVKRIDTDYRVSLSFEKNMENFLQKNRTRKPIQDIIWEAIDGSR